MNWDSFFDENVSPDQPFNIWKRIGASEDISPIEKENTIFEGYFLKSEAGSHELKERYFILKPNFLLYRKVVSPQQVKDSDETKAYLLNRYVRIKTFSADDPGEAEEASKFKVRFIRNLKYCDLFARNEAEYKEWLKHLSRFMIRMDFHERYKIRKMIGEGSFAKVLSRESGLSWKAKGRWKRVCRKGL